MSSRNSKQSRIKGFTENVNNTIELANATGGLMSALKQPITTVIGLFTPKDNSLSPAQIQAMLSEQRHGCLLT